ncbi:sensor histidine kinase [Paenibacillus hemerocallicola]|uniref:Sensor histidine kinase n=2 Tax=Paenibacillus hemerocallicola TaxID=1172614 RepID=A0A5C4TBF0_9BACL|nr:sensor histidine kinase [Paenibacillus hemerocallicola]
MNMSKDNWFVRWLGTRIFFRIFLMTAVMVTFALTVGAYFSLSLFTEKMEQKGTENIRNILEQTNKLIDSRMDMLLRISNLILNDPAIGELASERLLQDDRDKERMRGAIGKYIESDPGIVSVFLLNKERELFIPSDDFRSDAEDAEETKRRYLSFSNNRYSKGLTWVPTHRIDYGSESHNGENVLKLTREIFDSAAGAYRGTVVVNIAEESVYRYLKNVDVPAGTIFHVIDKNGIVISGTERSGVGKFEYSYTYMQAVLQKEGSFVRDYRSIPYLFVFNKLESVDWVIIGAIPVSELLSDRDRIMRGLGVILLLVLAVSLVGSLGIAYSISRPIKRLAEVMRKVRSGFFDVKAEIRSRDEIGMLGESFNEMIARTNELLHRLQESHYKEKNAEIRALQAQINPHFLYNTLASVVWLAENRDYDKITDLVSKLGRYYRQSLSRGMDVVTVRHELEHIGNYLAIEQIRYGTKFAYDISVEPAVYAHKCLKLLLQPLVENAIHHGIMNKEGNGWIRVDGWKEGDDIVLRVIDNGGGISRERLDEINCCFRSGRSLELAHSYGIKNVNERLQLVYGPAFGLFYSSEEGMGTTVLIRFPARYE